MRLYLIIYIAGHLAGTVGPLPYGEEECRARAADIIAQGDPNAVTPEGYRLGDVRFACEWRAERPAADAEEPR